VTAPPGPDVIVVKSTEVSTSQWALRKVFHVVSRLRSGAGSIPCARRIRATVVFEIRCPSSPARPVSARSPSWTLLRQPQDKLKDLGGNTDARQLCADCCSPSAWSPVPDAAQDRVWSNDAGKFSNIFRPTILPLTASRRVVVVEQNPFPSSFSRSTRFSVRRYSMGVCCCG